MMIVKIHNTSDGKSLVAICDSDLVGQNFEDGEFCLDLSSDFFAGEEKPTEEIEQIIKEAYLISFAGSDAVELGKRLGLVEESKIIASIPFAQVVNVDE